jgi:dipeptidyl aminopeptidase/acylaminoacyl peptidase
MRPTVLMALVLSSAGALAASGPVPVPAAVTAEGVPAIPASLADEARPYLEYRSAAFKAWDPVSRGLLIATRFGNAAQIHRVLQPGAQRTQLTFEADPVGSALTSPGGDVTVVSKDVGGGEFYQYYRLDRGRLVLLTDGSSRNTDAVFSRDGKLMGYTSTRRNGTDSDLYLVDPRDPRSDRLLAALPGPGWAFADFAPSGQTALVIRELSVEQSEVHEIELGSGARRRISPEGAAVSYAGAHYGADGSILVSADEGADVHRLGRLGRDGRFVAAGPASPWELEEFAVSADGGLIACVFNEDGASRLQLLDGTSLQPLGQPRLPAGVISGLAFAPWGELGFSLDSATSPSEAWSLDPRSLNPRRWTTSETGGLDPGQNREPELLRVKSFDGLEISGLLYRPDRQRFPGRRPLVVAIHGGPEGQARPGFIGRSNYLVNELGIALFLPNVRGSTGYGKRFVSLDNGPFRREDSVKDIGAFLDRLAADADIDARRLAVAGGSYGGYMCYAAAIRYGARLRSAQCTVAISNFVTFLENTQSYRRDLRRIEYGDERDPVQRAKLMEISPLSRARELQVPLLVVTGANDPRVPASEARQMVEAVRANGTPVWHLLAANEGHGWRRKENVDYQFLATLTFWQQTLMK